MAADINAPLFRKLDEMSTRFDALREQLNDPGVLGNPQKVIADSKEAGQLEPVVSRYRDYQKLLREIADLKGMAADPEMAELAAAELPEAQQRAAAMIE